MGMFAKTTEDKGLTVRQGIAVALLLCFFTALVISQVFAVAHAGHDHNHDDADGGCTICALISNAQGRLNQAGVLVRVSAVSATVLAGILIMSAFFTSGKFYTLVHLKIQSNC